MAIQSGIEIREMSAIDPALIVTIHNAVFPEPFWLTEEEVMIHESLAKPDQPPMRLAAWSGDRPVALGSSGISIFSPEGKYWIGATVLPEFRRQGIATTMYDRLHAFALERGANALQAGVQHDFVSLSEDWLAREGYREVERMRPSDLELIGLDLDAFRSAEERVEGQGITMTTLAEEDTEANRRKLWEVSELTRRDIPTHGPFETFPFEQFTGLLDRPEARPSLLVIAKDRDGSYLGYTMLIHQTPQRALTGLTGVNPEYRGRGIALATKVRCARLAREAQYTSMRTYNHVNNPAMLAVNDKLGYVELPHQLVFQKDLGA